MAEKEIGKVDYSIRGLAEATNRTPALFGMARFCSLDPGKATGTGIFNGFGSLVFSGSIFDDSSVGEYVRKLEALKTKNPVSFAIIEAYENYGIARPNASKVQTQIRMLQEVYPDHVMVKHPQWNPRRYTNKFKKQSWFPATFGRVAATLDGHAIDACLMGSTIFGLLRERASHPFLALLYTARTTKKYPTQKQQPPWTKAGYFEFINNFFEGAQ